MPLQAAPRRTDVLTARLSLPADLVTTIGRAVALAGVVLPLLLIGLLKFTAVEIEALKPLIGGTSWLA